MKNTTEKLAIALTSVTRRVGADSADAPRRAAYLVQEERLDHALEETFPASDPVAVSRSYGASSDGPPQIAQDSAE
jgi:hypothetical protein